MITCHVCELYSLRYGLTFGGYPHRMHCMTEIVERTTFSTNLGAINNKLEHVHLRIRVDLL